MHPSRAACRLPLLFASLTGRSGHGFAYRLSLGAWLRWHSLIA